MRPDVNWLDLAAKKHLGAKSYTAYLADLYDQFTGDNPGMYGLDPAQNPWKESVEEGITVVESRDAELSRFIKLAGIKQ
ncbi:MAG: hypothetical protein HC836_31800 [Richelia sp. RM2_1_2]|nr:hypothetical protein [Richelia sp. RM2_1_2]